MAIEFHCPYCTATVRVGDEASGKIGRCPKCDTRLRIPTLPPTAGSLIPKQGAAPPEPITDEQTEIPQLPTGAETTGAATTGEGNTESPSKNPGQLLIVPDAADSVSSKYSKRRKKKSSNFASWIPPLIFGGIFVAVAFFYFNHTKPSFEGALTAEKVNPNQSIRVELEGSTFNIDQKIFSDIIIELRENPSMVHSNLVSLKFAAGADGLEMSLRPGVQADLVKVPVTDLKPINKYYKNHYEELDNLRLKEIQNGLISLALDWVQAPEEAKKYTLPSYRNSIAYNAFVKGLGRICFAQVGKGIYPCVHEDGSGSLYFLVPLNTETFTIRERQDLDKTLHFPSELVIQVTVEKPKIAESELVPVEPEAVQEEDSSGADDPNSESKPGKKEMLNEKEMSPSSMKMMNQ